VSSQNQFEGVLKGQPLQVDIAAIEDQLRELWKDTAGEGDTLGEDKTRPVARASVLNLVVYVESTEQAQSTSEAIADLTVENPCRAIMVIAGPDDQPSTIRAWISAHCHGLSPANKMVCCEQISLEASGMAVKELSHTVFPLLVSNLPVFLWWKGSRLFEVEFLEGFSGVCDRLIVDSKRFTSPEADFPRLQSYLKSHRDRLAVSDVAWHRLLQWRELAAQFFDAAVFRVHLHHIAKVVIEFNERAADGAGIPPQAYLLAGWLASRLQWSVQSGNAINGGHEFQMRAKEDGRTVTVIIQPTEAQEVLCGHLVSLEISTGDEWATTFRIAKGESPQFAQTEIAFTNLPPYHRVVPLRIYNEVELIARQLEIFGHDPIYEQSIAMAADIVGSLC
jgi:glucose-6-phosphate dehydrogenase assembly protein OpcA